MENVNGAVVPSEKSGDDEEREGAPDLRLIGQVELIVKATEQNVKENVALDCKTVEEEGSVVGVFADLGWIRRIVGEV